MVTGGGLAGGGLVGGGLAAEGLAAVTVLGLEAFLRVTALGTSFGGRMPYLVVSPGSQVNLNSCCESLENRFEPSPSEPEG